ncbi:MAG: hypothetical protein HRK26_01135 [Rickettsiaceae bacterium H1]|nr:hypothetical protein [Rickettsiaceae bacterium H1]
MCWNGEASAVLASIGIGTTLYSAYKKYPHALWITLGYFSLMELLQAFTYIVIDECNSPMNQVLTLLSYLHIVFQPFFINGMSMYFIPSHIKNKISYFVYFLCFVSSILMLIQLYPFDWSGECNIKRDLCGKHLCSVSGEWHIAWEIPVNSIGNYFVENDNPLLFVLKTGYSYPIVAFILPIIYGSWKMTLYHYSVGPFLSNMLSNNNNETPAIWCLLSIGLLLVAIKTPLQEYLHVKRWFLWKNNQANKETNQ